MTPLDLSSAHLHVDDVNCADVVVADAVVACEDAVAPAAVSAANNSNDVKAPLLQ